LPPKFVRPCIPTTARTIPQGDAWLHEPKLDGYRFQIVKDGRLVSLYSRGGTTRPSGFLASLTRSSAFLAVLQCWTVSLSNLTVDRR
jgi:ATP-dependent DNA ligase